MLSHIVEIKGLEHAYKLRSYSIHYQLVLGWNLIWTCKHDSFDYARIDKNSTRRKAKSLQESVTNYTLMIGLRRSWFSSQIIIAQAKCLQFMQSSNSRYPIYWGNNGQIGDWTTYCACTFLIISQCQLGFVHTWYMYLKRHCPSHTNTNMVHDSC